MNSKAIIASLFWKKREEEKRIKRDRKLRLFQHKYFRVVYVAAKDQGIYMWELGSKM